MTQVGDPLANRHEGFANGISADRLARLTGSPVAQAEDNEEAEAEFLGSDVTEGRIATFCFAEVGPFPEDAGLFVPVLEGSSFGGEVESRAEVSSEEISGLRCRRRQGFSCG